MVGVNLPCMPNIKTEFCIRKQLEKTAQFGHSPPCGLTFIHIFDQEPVAQPTPQRRREDNIRMHHDRVIADSRSGDDLNYLLLCLSVETAWRMNRNKFEALKIEAWKPIHEQNPI
jgi:hypothetical protein